MRSTYIISYLQLLQFQPLLNILIILAIVFVGRHADLCVSVLVCVFTYITVLQLLL